MPRRTPFADVRTWRGAGVAITAALALTTVHVSSGAWAQSSDRGIEAACREGAQRADAFADVDRDDAHAGAIDCLWAYGVVSGRIADGDRRYEPGSEVSRQQMASFVANALGRIPADRHQLPEAGDGPDFDDAGAISQAHATNVDRLQQAGILSGYDDGTFRPGEPIDRAQMAAFVARAIEHVTGTALPRDEDAGYQDVSGTHRDAIEKLTTIGVVQGHDATTYAPSATTTRAQMATMIARSLDYFVEEGRLEPVAHAPGTGTASLAITEVDTAAHSGFDRVTFTLEGSDDLAGWTLRYVDEAIAQGSGQRVDVEGDAILEVVLTGISLPADSDVDRWGGERITVDGAGIVEIVDLSVYEGRQQIFVGTTGIQPFTVDRLADPQRVYLDVTHGG